MIAYNTKKEAAEYDSISRELRIYKSIDKKRAHWITLKQALLLESLAVEMIGDQWGEIIIK